MTSTLIYHDPTVPAHYIERYKLAYLMQFFVQHKQRFKFPRIRLQDLFKLLENQDIRPLAYLVVQILKFLKIPNAAILSVDKALDYFSGEKRTSTRICISQLRSGRQISDLNAETKAKLLENLIETVYDELPDFNFAPNGFNTTNSGNAGAGGAFCGGGNKALVDIKQEETADDSMNELAIKAGCDSKGSSYVYLDDLRLYREKPQSSLSAQWDVVVGPTVEQWQAFIRSLGNTDEEGDLKAFLQDHLLEVVCTSLESGELMQDNPELFVTNLLNREQMELTGVSGADYHGSGPLQQRQMYDINDSGGGGPGSGPMNCTDSSSTVKQEMPDTPDSFSGSSYMNSTVASQNQIVPRSSSYPGSHMPTASPLHGSLSSPAHSAHGAPSTPSGDINQMKSSPRVGNCQGIARESVKMEPTNIPMTFAGQNHQGLYHSSMHGGVPPQHVSDPMMAGGGGQMRYPNPAQHRFSCPSVMIGGNGNGNGSGSGQVMVFTTQMANDGAVELQRHRTPLAQWHSQHPAVVEFIQFQYSQNRLLSLQKPYEQLTQKQLENRKNKMAKLEQIQSTLSKSSKGNSGGGGGQQQMCAAATTTTSNGAEINARPLSSNQTPNNCMMQQAAAMGESVVDSGDMGQPTADGGPPSVNSGQQQQGYHGSMAEQHMMSQQYFSGGPQMAGVGDQQGMLMVAGGENMSSSNEAAQRQWELLRMEYMREKQAHDAMSGRFSTEMTPYSNGGTGPPAAPNMMPGNLPVGAGLMSAGHRAGLIRQTATFPHGAAVQMDAGGGGVIYPPGMKRPYQMIGAPPPPGYHAHPMYHIHHEPVPPPGQRAILLQQQGQQGPPRCAQMCDPSWSMIGHPSSYGAGGGGHHHPAMHQAFAAGMYHRGPTPPAAVLSAAANGPIPAAQGAAAGGTSTATTPATSSKSKSKKRKSNTKSASASSAANATSTASNATAAVVSNVSTVAPSQISETKPQVPQPSCMSGLADHTGQRFISPMMGSGPQEEMGRNLPNFQDSVINGSISQRNIQLSDSQIMANSVQLKNSMISPNKSNFSPISDVKSSSGSLSSSSHAPSVSLSSTNFPSSQQQQPQQSAYCSSSSISSPSQNLTSASLASLARLSSQMSGGGDSPLFNSLQPPGGGGGQGPSNSVASGSKGSGAFMHSMGDLQQGSSHQGAAPSAAGNIQSYHSAYPAYRHPASAVQPPQQGGMMQQDIHARLQKPSAAPQTMSGQSGPTSGYPQGQTVTPQQQHQSHEVMFGQYQQFPGQAISITPGASSNHGGIPTTNNGPGIISGVQPTPSIMVNNTFVNAQLNVQQMNYQHLAAPNVNAQMQIQQQHQGGPQPTVMGGVDSGQGKQLGDSSSNVNNGTAGSAQQPLNAADNSGTNSSNAVSIQPANGAFMNSSSVVQIQSKTPHTIQYLPAEPVATPTAAQMDMTMGSAGGGNSKYGGIAAPSLELDELLPQGKPMNFPMQNTDMPQGLMGNPHQNNIMMMGQQQIEAHQFRFQQQARLRGPSPVAAGIPAGSAMIMRQTQSQQQQQQQQQLVLQQSFGGPNASLFDQQMKQHQIQRFMMVNSGQQQQQQLIMGGQLPTALAHPHYVSIDAGGGGGGDPQQQQHLYHQQQFIAMQQQQQQQQIRQQSQTHPFG